jgi:DNA-binding response OmpR family regulator
MLCLRPFPVLEFLVRHQDHMVARSTLLEMVRYYHFDPRTDVVEVQISRLCQKIAGIFLAVLAANRLRRRLYDRDR